jgi:hypothetical protein
VQSVTPGTVFQNPDIYLRRSLPLAATLGSCRDHDLAARGLYLNWPSLGSRTCDPATLCQELLPVFRIPKSFRTA